jgi:hypothetical protein
MSLYCTLYTHSHTYTEIHLSGLIDTAILPDMQKYELLDFPLKRGYIGSLNFGCYY